MPRPSTLLHVPLTTRQQITIHYLTPAVLSALVYVLHLAADTCLALQHHRAAHPVPAALTLLLLWAPVIASLVFTLSNPDLWPEEQGWGRQNAKWLMVKLAQHAAFPVWAMYRSFTSITINIHPTTTHNHIITVFSPPSTLLHVPLTTRQQILIHYLTPALLSALVYVLHVATDTCLALRDHRAAQPVPAALTLLLLWAPVIASLVFTLSNPDLWPEEQGWGRQNAKWLLVKLAQHAAFPVWAMFRFAEQLFWSIEAFRSTDESDIQDCMTRAERNSVFELYHFLQAYLQAAPQILFQMHLIFQQTNNFNKATVDMQVFCIIMSLIRLAMTTTSYQRFKSQKPTGRQYPWRKEPKPIHLNTIHETYRSLATSNVIAETIQEEEENHLKEEHDSAQSNVENSDAEADQDQSKIAVLSRKSSGLSVTSSQFEVKIKKKDEDQPDFVLPVKIIFYRGLPEDDAAGKLVSFFWWFCFILPRMLALSAFAYFYQSEVWYICGAHYIICLGFLLYDAHTSDIPYYRAVFILFTAYIYMFCLIEFKIKFKKVRFIYNGYFLLVYLENFIMTNIWYHSEEFNFSDWWYRYIFYLILGSSIISAASMLFYIFILKPPKVTINQGYRNSKVL